MLLLHPTVTSKGNADSKGEGDKKHHPSERGNLCNHISKKQLNPQKTLFAEGLEWLQSCTVSLLSFLCALASACHSWRQPSFGCILLRLPTASLQWEQARTVLQTSPLLLQQDEQRILCYKPYKVTRVMRGMGWALSEGGKKWSETQWADSALLWRSFTSVMRTFIHTKAKLGFVFGSTGFKLN